MGLFSSKPPQKESPEKRVERLLAILTKDDDTPGCVAQLCPSRADGYSAYRWSKYAYAVAHSTDLNEGHQAFLLEALIEVKYNEGVIAKNNRRHGMWLLMVQAVLQAMIPILIPIAQNMSSSDDKAVVEAGSAIAYTAVFASLIGTVCMVIEKTRKFSAIGAELFKHQANLLSIVEAYLGMAGPVYDRLRVTEDSDDSKSKVGQGQERSWHVFMEQYQQVRSHCDIGRNNIYSGKSPESGNESSGEVPNNVPRSRSEDYNESLRSSKKPPAVGWPAELPNGAPFASRAAPPPVRRATAGSLRQAGQTDDSQVHPLPATAPLPPPASDPALLGSSQNDDVTVSQVQ